MGDDPKKVKRDRKRFASKQKYEVSYRKKIAKEIIATKFKGELSLKKCKTVAKALLKLLKKGK